MDFSKDRWISFSIGKVKYSLCIDGRLWSHQRNRLKKAQSLSRLGCKQLYYTLGNPDRTKTIVIQIPKLVHTMFKLPLLPEENVLQWDDNNRNNHVSNLEKIYRGDHVRLNIIRSRKGHHIDGPVYPNGTKSKPYYRFSIKTKEGKPLQKFFRNKNEAVLFRDNYIAENFKHLLKY